MRKNDIILNIFTYLFSTIGVIILFAITFYIFSNGFKVLSWDLLTSNYYDEVYSTKHTDDVQIATFVDPGIEDTYFSKNFGISLKDELDNNNNEVVKIVYIDKNSPFNHMKDAKDENVQITTNQIINKVIITDNDDGYYIALSGDGADGIVQKLDLGTRIIDMTTLIPGGGIRGSLIATLYLIFLTLLISLPIGIIAAIYLCEYCREGKLKKTLISMIDLTNGIPSIVFGLVGVLAFIPLVNSITNTNGGSLLSGSLTLSIMLLPIIVRNTMNSINTVPKSFRDASLALGASKSQTIFKVVLPNAISGILTSIILSIGKIIGESAALIYAIGTVIKDNIFFSDKATTLAVHIWVLMSGDKPNFEASCAVALIILIMVFVLSMLIKIISKRLNKYNVSTK